MFIHVYLPPSGRHRLQPPECNNSRNILINLLNLRNTGFKSFCIRSLNGQMAKTAATSKRGPHPPRKGGRPAKKPFKVGGADGRNATGYQKRQERKNKQREEQNPDVYEYAVGKNKRAGISMQLDDDELLGNDKRGAEDDDNDDSDMEKLRRKIAANMEGDMGVVDSEDDEDIDSDAAFEGESDEERFGAFKFAESVCGAVSIICPTR